MSKSKSITNTKVESDNSEGRMTLVQSAIYHTTELIVAGKRKGDCLSSVLILLIYRLTVLLNDKSVQRTPIAKHLPDLAAICDSVFYTLLAQSNYRTAGVSRMKRKPVAQYYDLSTGQLTNTTKVGNEYKQKASDHSTALGYINMVERLCGSSSTLLACFGNLPTTVGEALTQIAKNASVLDALVEQSATNSGSLAGYKALAVMKQFTKKPAEPAKDAPADAVIHFKPALLEYMTLINSMPQREYMTVLAQIKKLPALVSYQRDTAAKLTK